MLKKSLLKLVRLGTYNDVTAILQEAKYVFMVNDSYSCGGLLCGWLYLSHKKNISFWLYKKAFKG